MRSVREIDLTRHHRRASGAFPTPPRDLAGVAMLLVLSDL